MCECVHVCLHLFIRFIVRIGLLICGAGKPQNYLQTGNPRETNGSTEKFSLSQRPKSQGGREASSGVDLAFHRSVSQDLRCHRVREDGYSSSERETAFP